MATIRRQHGKWQAVVRRKGYPQRSKTFDSKQECMKWARVAEHSLDTGDAAIGQQLQLHAAVERYIAEVSIHKRGYLVEKQRLNQMLRLLPNIPIDKVTSKHIAAYRDTRLEHGVSGSTIVRELNNLSHIFGTATMEWGVVTQNPVKDVRKPKQARGRDRRVTAEELTALKASKIGAIVTLAVETGMRLSELLSLEWRLIDAEQRTATLPMTKNGEKRIVPLSSLAMVTLSGMKQSAPRVFSQWQDKNSAGNAWKRTVSKLRKDHEAEHGPSNFLEDIRFHDLRHEAASRLFEKGLNMMEVASVTGHRTLNMLKRYVHLRASDIALKL
jgi:integrase